MPVDAKVQRGLILQPTCRLEGGRPVVHLHGRLPLDHEHYIDKQVRPVAEQVLALLGLDFGQLVGDGRQLRLL